MVEIAEGETLGIKFAMHKRTKRVRVIEVHTDSIAMKVGIKVNDVILAPQSSEGQSIDVYASLLEAAQLRPTSLCFEVRRQVVAQDEMESIQDSQAFHRFIITKPGELGIALQDNEKKTDNKATMSYVAQVFKVTTDSISDIYGIQDRDIIYKASINGTLVANCQDLVDHIKAGSRPIVLDTVRSIGAPRKEFSARANSTDNPFTITFPSQEIDSNEKDANDAHPNDATSVFGLEALFAPMLLSLLLLLLLLLSLLLLLLSFE